MGPLRYDRSYLALVFELGNPFEGRDVEKQGEYGVSLSLIKKPIL